MATSQDSLFGMPAITPVPSEPKISDLNLVDKNILWTKVTSAGVSLPLPLDSCCSVSLVSKNHAETVAKFNPNFQFTKLEQPIPVSVAGPNSSLKAVGTMQVPIVWENGQINTRLNSRILNLPYFLQKSCSYILIGTRSLKYTQMLAR